MRTGAWDKVRKLSQHQQTFVAGIPLRTCQNIRSIFSTEMHIDAKHSRTPIFSKSPNCSQWTSKCPRTQAKSFKGQGMMKGREEGEERKKLRWKPLWIAKVWVTESPLAWTPPPLAVGTLSQPKWNGRNNQVRQGEVLRPRSGQRISSIKGRRGRASSECQAAADPVEGL